MYDRSLVAAITSTAFVFIGTAKFGVDDTLRTISQPSIMLVCITDKLPSDISVSQSYKTKDGTKLNGPLFRSFTKDGTF